jgi:hypothetical protein
LLPTRNSEERSVMRRRMLGLVMVHLSAWKENSAQFALPAVSEVACPSAPAGAAELPPRPDAS